jgi:hypothetical protein
MRVRKPAIGVSHAMIEGKPSVMIALYVDYPSVQVTNDDGRPLSLAAMEPEAPYNALTTGLSRRTTGPSSGKSSCRRLRARLLLAAGKPTAEFRAG